MSEYFSVILQPNYKNMMNEEYLNFDEYIRQGEPALRERAEA